MKVLKKATAGLIAATAMVIGTVSTAQADIPAEAVDAVTGLVTDSAAFVGSLWAIVVPVTIGFIFIRLFKKGANKAV